MPINDNTYATNTFHNLPSQNMHFFNFFSLFLFVPFLFLLLKYWKNSNTQIRKK
ncbi:hypothetical protein RDI58_000386 [Solanum bulbocastanum]|uniref:Uncharacterized protein n=1 Tax=Solanum bulbocastanum TaxID=147425 RepID=A0AAN8YP18_SOLBU